MWYVGGYFLLCCAVLCCAVLCCAVLCCAVLCCAVLCCAVLCCAVQYAEGMVFKVYLQEGRIIKSTELVDLVNTEE
jgi:hypothetical protein